MGSQRMAIWVHIRILLAAAFLVATFACSATLAAESKRIMLLHSFGREFQPWSEYAKSIRSELVRQSPWPLDIIEHSLVTARFSDEDPEAPFVEYLRALFAKRPLDLIVSIGATAPIFSYDESFFGSAIVGGPLLLAADTGRQTAAAGIRILNGEKPGEIRPPPVQFASPVYSRL